MKTHGRMPVNNQQQLLKKAQNIEGLVMAGASGGALCGRREKTNADQKKNSFPPGPAIKIGG